MDSFLGVAPALPLKLRISVCFIATSKTILTAKSAKMEASNSRTRRSGTGQRGRQERQCEEAATTKEGVGDLWLAPGKASAVTGTLTQRMPISNLKFEI
jgi:hypothetical protein